MYKKCVYFIFGFLSLSFSLTANDSDDPKNMIYLVPECGCEFITRGHSIVLDGHLTSFFTNNKLGVRIQYNDGKDDFSCSFRGIEDQILTIGTYKEATRSNSAGRPGIDISGFSRGYNRSIGEFEIFEIVFDDKGLLLSFAADFKISSESHPENYITGAVRFNSSVAIDEYFIQKTNQILNLQNEHLFYLRRLGANSDSIEDVITIDKSELFLTLKEDQGCFILNVFDLDKCLDKNRLTIYMSNLNELSKPYYFTENPYLKQQTPCKSSAPLWISTNKQEDIYPKQGYYSILELVVDFHQNKILSLAIDCKFEDEKGLLYEGIVRFNSTIPAMIE